MKKIISLLIVAAFVFGLAAIPVVNAQEQERNVNLITSNETEGLEKISSPDQIKDFRIMKKIGNVLFGIRKATTTPRIATSTLEKIDHPGLLNLFERIQKIGTALWGIRKKATSTPFIIAPEVSNCVAVAIDVKDKALMARVTAAATELNTALSIRSACQQSAVMASSTPREVLNSCVKTFNNTNKAIKEASKKVQKDSWSVYLESLKACRTAASSTSPVPMIEDGGNIFD